MKNNLFNFARYAVLAAALVFASCSDDDTPPVTPPPVIPPVDIPELIISADVLEIYSDGEETVTFSVKYGEEVVTDSSIIETEDGKLKLEGSTFRTDEPGQYTFRAVYNDSISVNSVKINVIKFTPPMVQAESKYKKRILIQDVTGTWCQNCPFMVELIAAMRKYYKQDLFREVFYHQGRDPYALNISDWLAIYYQGARFGVPMAVIDFRTWFTGAYEEGMVAGIETSLLQYPAEAGIAISTTLNGSNLDYTISFEVDRTNNYSLHAVIVEDGLVAAQTYPTKTDPNYVHNSVLRHYITDHTLLESEYQNVQKGETKTVSGTIAVTNVKELENCRIVAWVASDNPDYDDNNEVPSHIVTNVTDCKLGSSVEIEYIK